MPKRNARIQVGIVGAGPAGLFLSHLLHAQGIESVVLETRSRERVENRIRAGMMEPGTVQALTEAGLGARMHKEGLPHTGALFHYDGATRRLDLQRLTGRTVMMYGQREVVRDLLAARARDGGEVLFEVSDVVVTDVEGPAPAIRFRHEGEEHLLRCDFVAGCDGFHGVCRAAIPGLTSYAWTYPVAWLGILAEAPPLSDELLYACHERGLALFSMRSRTISRHYLQVAPGDSPDAWPAERVWSELRRRIDHRAAELIEGPILDKSMVQLRSFVAEPMQAGRLFLAGDAAHIVPPSAAKGLNLAVSDVRLLAEALRRYYAAGDEQLLRDYSRSALARAWEGQRISRWMTDLLHRFDEGPTFTRRLQVAELDRLFASEAAARSFAEAYVGPPLSGG